MNKLKFLQNFIPGKFTYRLTDTGHLVDIEGDDYELLKILAQYLKFDYEIIGKPKIVTSGIRHSNGTWTGMFGMLQRNEIDVVIGNLWKPHSSEVADFSHPFDIIEETFAISKAGFASKDFIYVSPFEISVWLCTILVISLCGLFILGIRRYSEKARRQTLLDELFYSFELSARNFGVHRRKFYTKFSTRLFLGFCCIGMVCLKFTYMSIFPSFLMAPIMEPQISTFDQLAKACRNNQAKVTIVKDLPIYKMFLESKIQIYKDLGLNIRNKPESLLLGILDIPPAVENGYAVLFVGNLLEILFVGKENVLVSSDALTTYAVSIVFKKNFCYQEKFNSITRRVREHGIYQKLVKDSTFLRNLKSRGSHRENIIRPIGLPDITGILWLLCGCYIICTAVFVIELCVPKRQKKRKKKKIRKL